MPVDRPVELGPIITSDVGRVAHFLHTNLNHRVPTDAWRAAMRKTWVDAPNHGFMLKQGTEIVGAYLAFYSRREVEDRIECFCNLGAWCVLEEHRSHGLKLVRAMLRQRGYTFTDFSPSGNVVRLNQRLRFSSLDTATAAMLNLPWPRSKRVSVTSDRARIERALTGRDLTIYRDHADAGAARHLLVTEGDDSCYVIFRRDRRKRLPGFGSILYVSDPHVFQHAQRQVSHHLLMNHQVFVTLAELRLVGPRPRGAAMIRRPRPKMFKSDHIRSDQVDYLYSELTNVAW